MLTVGILTGIGLYILRIPLVLTLVILAALLTFIPYFGSVISSVPGVLIALLGKRFNALYVICLYLFAHGIERYILSPLIQRRQVRVPPALIISAQVLLGVFAGLLGLIFATPFVAMIIVLVKKIYIQDMLGGKTAAVEK